MRLTQAAHVPNVVRVPSNGNEAQVVMRSAEEGTLTVLCHETYLPESAYPWFDVLLDGKRYAGQAIQPPTMTSDGRVMFRVELRLDKDWRP